MILDYLYYGNSIQLLPNEMRDYLEVAFILENDYPIKKQICAVEKIEGMDALQTISFLPILIDILLLASKRQFRREQTDQDSVIYFQKKCKEIIKSMFVSSTEQDIEDRSLCQTDTKLRRCPLSGIVQQIETIKIEEIPHMVSEYIEKHMIPKTDIEDSFLESDFYAPEIFLLSLLGTAKKENPEALQDMDLNKLFHAALNKECGLFLWQLAVDLYVDMADTFQELTRCFPKYWKSIPCCIRAAIRYRIDREHNAKYIEENESIPAALMRESWQWNIYQDVGMYKVHSDGLVEGSNDEELQLMAVIIWQLVCWDVAYGYDPDFCAKKAANYWNTPTYSNHGTWKKELADKQLINDIQKRVVKGSCTTVFNEKTVATAVASPWLYCDDSAEYVEEPGNFEDFPLFIRPFIALRSFFAAIWLRKVLREDRKIYQESSQLINDYRVLINMGDAYDCRGARIERADGNIGKKWSVSLRGLACFAYDCVQILGKGQENSTLPLEIIENIAKGRNFTNKELAKLQSGRSLLVSARWAAESLSAVTNPNDISKCAWFREDDRDGVAGAERVCYRLLERHYEKAIKSRYVHELLDQLYGSLIDQMNEIQEGHWTDRFMEDSEDFGLGEEKVGLGEVIFQGMIAQEDWDRLTGIDIQDFTPAAWLVVQTRRLRCLIDHYREELLEDAKAQMALWHYTLSSLPPDEIRQNPVILFELCQLLRTDSEKFGRSFYNMSEIVSIVIDTVFDFIDEDHLYYAGILSVYLSTEQTYYPYNDRSMADARRNYVIHLYDMASGDSDCRKLLNRYLSMIQKSLETPSAISLQREIHKEFMARNMKKSTGILKKIKPDEWSSLTDRFLQKKGDDLTVVRTPQNIARDFWNKPVDNGFTNSVDQSRGEKTGRLGIIYKRKDCSTEEDKRRGKNVYQYKVRISDRFIYMKRNNYFDAGEVVAVSVDKDGNNALYSLSWQIGKDFEVVLVKRPEYKIKNNRIEFQFVLPNNQVLRYPYVWTETKRGGMSENTKDSDNTEKFSNLLDYWVPDIIGSYQPDFMFAEDYYEVFFDEEVGGYLPVKRDFSRLLLERIFIIGNEKHKVKLVYIKSESIRNQCFDLFSAAPGINYFLPRWVWIEESREAILGENSLEYGLRINCELVEIEGIPYLQPCTEQPAEYDNLDLRNVISEGNSCYLNYNEEEKSLEYSFEIREKKYTINAFVTDRLIRRSCNVTVAVNGWTSMNQRRQVIDCVSMNEYLMNDAFCNVNAIQKIMNLKPGDQVYLDRLITKNTKYGSFSGKLDSGLAVLCAAETISMCTPFAESLCRDRDCVIENIYEYPANATFRYRPFQIPELNGLDEVEGIIGKFISPQENEIVWLDLWLLKDNGVIVVKVPYDSFSVPPTGQGMVVTGSQTSEGGWIFYVHNRKINVRALWKIKDHTEDVNIQIQGTVLAQNVKIAGKSGYCTVSQDLQEPIMHLWNSQTTVSETVNCGIVGHDGMVHRVNPHFCDNHVFRYIKRQDTVFLKQNNMLIWGESALFEFDRSQRAWSVKLLMDIPTTLSGLNLYDIHRIFHKEVITSIGRTTSLQNTMNQAVNVYEEWLIKEDGIVFGVLEKGSVVLRDMKIPERVSEHLASDRFTDRVLLLPKEEITWVSVHPKYPYSSQVRAVLKERDDRWYASCKDAKPYRLDSDLIAEFHAIDGQMITQYIYYAGYDEKRNFRFEWGYGYHFLVNPADLLDENGNETGSNLFFGDCIQEFKFIKGNGSYNWQMCINESAVEHQIVYHIWHDAVENNVLQLLKVHIDRYEQEVSITDVTLVDYSLHISRGMSGWNYHNYRRGRLNSDSVNRLLAEDGDVIEERVILAELDARSVVEKCANLIFNYISLDEADEKPEKLNGKTICMVGRNIETTGYTYDNHSISLSNDYQLRFELPGRSDFAVMVLRRAFSLDESKLRVCVSEDSMDKYNDKNMLVTIRDRRHKHSWSGSVIGNICRSNEGLKAWIREYKSCFVVLDDPHNGKVRVEIAPGIICRLDVNVFKDSSKRQLRVGDLASLSLNADDGIVGQIVFPSDRNYISEKGRVVELLPMDGPIRHYLANWRNLTKGDWDERKDQLKNDDSHFSIAGFPQIRVKNRKELEKAMKEPFPRLRWIRRKKDSFEIVNDAEFTAANLSIDHSTNQPKLTYFYPEKKEEETEWSRISYMDASPYEIRRFAEKGKWNYHDKETIIYNSLKSRFEKKWLPRGKFNNLVVFPDTAGSLRMKLSDMILHGYSAREIAENGLPDKNQFYPVAGVTRSSIWIELMPGRIIELPKNYLLIGGEHIFLNSLHTHCFAAGDLIRFDEEDSFVGGQRTFQIKEFRSGIRGMLGNRNTYLPILDISREKGMVLGFEKLHMTYPAVNIGDWYGNSVICLTSDNQIMPVHDNVVLKYGDTVFLCRNGEGNITTCGNISDAVFRPAYKDTWKNAEWLYDIMRSDYYAGKFLEDIYLPVMITDFQYKENGAIAYYTFVQENLDAMPENTILCGVCIGVFLERIEDGEKEWKVLVRSGHNLIRVKYKNFLRGIDPRFMRDVVKELASDGKGLWFHKKTDGEWHSGICDSTDEDAPKVELLKPIERAKGYLCQSNLTMCMYWLPVSRAVRVEWSDILQIWTALSKRPLRNTKRMPSGVISLIDTTISNQKYKSLHFNHTKFRVIPHMEIKNDNAVKNHNLLYLAELYPLGDLVYLESEIPLINEIKPDYKPIVVELIKKQPNHVLVTPYGTIRTDQHLPSWINTAMASVWHNGHYNVTRFQNSSSKSTIPVRYAKYKEDYLNGNNDAKRNYLNMKYLKERVNVEKTTLDEWVLLKAKICYLSAFLDEGKITDEKRELAYQFAVTLIREWLDRDGKVLISSLGNDKEILHKRHMDLLPLLCVVRLVDAIGRIDTEKYDLKKIGLEEEHIPSIKEFAVHLTRIMGLLCDSSVHVEVLVRKWIYADKLPVFWNCLDNISLGGVTQNGEYDKKFAGDLLPRQVDSIRATCNHIRKLSSNRSLEDLRMVGDSLLYSIGELEDYDLFMTKFKLSSNYYYTVRLALLGHLLTPVNNGTTVALPSLDSNMRYVLKNIVIDLAKNGWPLAVMIDYVFPLCANERLAVKKIASTAFPNPSYT